MSKKGGLREDDLLKNKLINYLKSNEIPSSELKKVLKSVVKTEKKVMIPKSERKYKLLLKFLNSLLLELKKGKIDDVLKFKNINRKSIIEIDSDKLVKSHINEIVLEYGKTGINYSKMGKTNLYILILIRRMCKVCGYKLESTYRTVNEKIGEYYKPSREIKYKVVILC